MSVEDQWCQHPSTICRLVCTAWRDNIPRRACSRVGTEITSGHSAEWQASYWATRAVQLSLEGLDISWHCATSGKVLSRALWLFDCCSCRTTQCRRKDSWKCSRLQI